MSDMRLGLIGAGHISASHLAGWHRAAGVEVHGIFDLRAELAAERADRFRIPRVFADAGELIAACDVIDVCTPPATHAELARRVLGAGKHLLIEKPLITDLADWAGLADILRDSSAKLAVTHNLKFARGVRQATKWLRQGRIGRLLHLHRSFLTHPDCDRMLVGKHWSHTLPGGRWFETLPHELYLIHHFAGPLEVRQVSALTTATAPAGVPADEVVVTLSGGDRIATIQFSANCRLNKRQLVLVGSEGLITIDILSDSATLSRLRDGRWQRAAGGLAETAGRLAAWPVDRGGYVVDRLRKRSPHNLLIERFAEHLLGRADSPTPLDEVEYVVRNADHIAREIGLQIGDSS